MNTNYSLSIHCRNFTCVVLILQHFRVVNMYTYTGYFVITVGQNIPRKLILVNKLIQAIEKQGTFELHLTKFGQNLQPLMHIFMYTMN